MTGNALSWLTSSLSGRAYFVRLGVDCSVVLQLLIGMPQGSVLGPLFSIMYIVDLVELIRSQNLQPHLYADDSQLNDSCRPENTLTLADGVTRCVDLVASWMRSKQLRLNSDKTEVIWVSTSRRQHQLPVWPMLIDGLLVHPVRTVGNLRVFIDADLVMRSHVTRVVAQCFAVLRQLRLIIWPMLVVAFNVEDGGRRVSPISIGLREQCADRSACILGKTSTVGT